MSKTSLQKGIPITAPEENEIAVYLTPKLLKRCGFAADVDIVRGGIEAMQYLTYQERYAQRKTGNPSVIFVRSEIALISIASWY